jgi:DNA-binding phage protein
MTEKSQIPQDDLMDVMEMTQKIEKYITRVLRDQDPQLAFSALISASINCLFAQCKTFEEVVFYRNLFIEILDRSIRMMKINKPEKPN